MGVRKRIGQSSNPRDQAHMRRVQAVLNARYNNPQHPERLREADAIAVLDWMRGRRRDDGQLFTDREIICEALIALGQKIDAGWEPEKFISEKVVSEQMAQLTERFRLLIDRLGEMDFSAAPAAQAKAMRDEISEVQNIFSTSNLIGKSFKSETSPDDW